jgi:transposase
MPVLVAPEVDAVAALDEVSDFAPVVVSGRSEGTEMSAGGVMEIELSGGRRLCVDRHVDAEALRRVLAVLGR